MWRLGTRNCFVEMPLFGIDDSSLKGFTLLSKEDSILKHNVIDYTNLSLLENEEAQKEVGLSEEEIKARFNPKEHVTYSLPGKYFYKVDKNLSKEEIAKRKKWSIWTNGLQIRVGDVVELYGDSRHVYRVSYIDKTIGKIYFDERDG